jgi:hypothetical protein
MISETNNIYAVFVRAYLSKDHLEYRYGNERTKLRETAFIWNFIIFDLIAFNS